MARLELDLGKGRTIMFGDNAKPKIVKLGDGFSMRTATIRLADGSEHPGAVELCDQDGGELYNAIIYLPEANDIADQNDGAEAFCAKLGRDRKQVFPYRYKYHGIETAYDHHRGADGWAG